MKPTARRREETVESILEGIELLGLDTCPAESSSDDQLRYILRDWFLNIDTVDKIATAKYIRLVHEARQDSAKTTETVE